MSFSDVVPGTPIIASNVQQVIDALKGTAGKGVPLTVSAVNDSARYALTLENTEATNSRALNVLKNDGSVLIRADATGVTLGQPLNLPTGSVTSTAILDGTIATADLANNAVTNVKLGTDTARMSLLTNGGFEVWQRGTNMAATQPTGAYHADRWYVTGAGTGTIASTRDTANRDTLGIACAAVTYTHVAGAQLAYAQDVKASENGLSGATVSFSMRIKTSVANLVRIGINNGSAWTYSAYHTGSGLYVTLTATATIVAGSNAIVAAWFDNAISGLAYLDSAMLVVGSVAADYAPLQPADDLNRCLRYYQRWSGNNGSIVSTNYVYGASNANAIIPPQAQMAVTPTVTVSGVGHFGMSSGAGGQQACTALTVQMQGSNFSLLASGTTAGGLTAGQSGAFSVTPAGAPGWIAAEANP